ncbi:hypothetical protein H5410_062491 [Solanum commersonii]|uniref:Uncharacterized protein n=1 Tax=Solanum commersonii TaxID=4109 RepID=A0A9J5WB12_SOLCO|nr:hypothetical protein H5410_062491 [Solanum commersonii]
MKKKKIVAPSSATVDEDKVEVEIEGGIVSENEETMVGPRVKFIGDESDASIYANLSYSSKKLT